MAERKKREKEISDKLEEFIAAGLLIDDAEKQRDEAITRANESCTAATAKARDLQSTHALGLKNLDLTDREISDLTDLPVSAVREMVKEAKKSSAAETVKSSDTGAAETPTSKPGSSSTDTDRVATDDRIAS
ncbi:hypothetical protein [Rhodococcus artemisiae]|uniref:Sigma-70-like protein n=1 Tax=Rhodococcus artemisiae TaxID=714159 RepID=A0ABU7LJR3_9NOCA|nr:hypothetical protein [Rhodococcus artemisiae]MEE2061805.1 hypothetical protein [Rhodococcus artemisiae]